MAGVRLTRKSPFRVDDGPGDFRWFFTAEYPRLVRTVHGVVQDKALAEDIAQDAFIQLLNHWAKVSRFDQPGAWVRRVAIRMAVRESGRGHRRRVLERSTLDSSPVVPQPGTDLDLHDAIRQLSPRQRAVVVLFYLEDRPMDEVAAILDLAPATGWVHLHRARHQLATILGEELDHDER